MWLEMYSAKKWRWFNANIFILNKIYFKNSAIREFKHNIVKMHENASILWKMDTF